MVPGEFEYETLTTLIDLFKPRIALTIAIKAMRGESLPIKAMRYLAAFRKTLDIDRTAGGTVCRAAISGGSFYIVPESKDDHIIIEMMIDAEVEITRPVGG